MTTTDPRADAWQACVNWFALRGPLNGSPRIPDRVLQEAEAANPFVEEEGQ